MKLLTKPSVTRERIESKIPARRETRFNPLGILGVMPIFVTQNIPERTVVWPYAGRSIIDKLKIDFEHEDAMDLCIEIGAYDFIKKKTAFALSFDGVDYVLHGVIPEKLLHDNVWECNIDHFEY
jgi:hypothetical protein